MADPGEPLGQYFDDVHVGDEHVSAARTLTEADAMHFVALVGDHSEAYVSDPFGVAVGHQGRIVPDLLGLAVAQGLVARLGLAEGTAVASIGWRWEMLRPLRPGETVRARWRIARTVESSKPDRGVLDERIDLVTTEDEIVQTGNHLTIRRRRPRP